VHLARDGRLQISQGGIIVEALKLKMMSPCVGYLDEVSASNALAARPASLEGKVLGLVPNWRPAAVHILSAIGTLLKERYHLSEVVMQPVVRISAMAKGGKLLDGIIDQLESLSQRVDIALTATGD
jgi:hypothetical protein